MLHASRTVTAVLAPPLQTLRVQPEFHPSAFFAYDRANGGDHPAHAPATHGVVIVKATASELLDRLPGKVTDAWPSGEPFVMAFAHGSMSVELYAPVGTD